MRFLTKIGVLALAGYGASQLYKRWEPAIRAALDPTRKSSAAGTPSVGADAPDVDLTSAIPPVDGTAAKSEQRAVDDMRNEIEALT